MRHLALAVSLVSSSACFLGVDEAGGDASDTATTEADSGASMGPSGTTAMSGTTDASGSADVSASADASASAESGPVTVSDSVGESTTGEMSGCETGPLPSPIPGCAPAPLASTGDVAQDCVDRINQFRWECQCLPPLARWADAETCTDDQSAADQSSGAAHGNFGVCNEYAQNTCPDWPSEPDIITGCLQAMWDEGPGEPFSAHGHYINMSSTDYTKVACGFSASGGGVWANQNFTQ